LPAPQDDRRGDLGRDQHRQRSGEDSTSTWSILVLSRSPAAGAERGASRRGRRNPWRRRAQCSRDCPIATAIRSFVSFVCAATNLPSYIQKENRLRPSPPLRRRTAATTRGRLSFTEALALASDERAPALCGIIPRSPLPALPLSHAADPYRVMCCGTRAHASRATSQVTRLTDLRELPSRTMVRRTVSR